MYVVIVGAGKVGWNLARELIAKRHEITVIESDPVRFSVVDKGPGYDEQCLQQPFFGGPPKGRGC